MDNIIIGFTDRKKGEVIKEIVTGSGFYNVDICTTGDEILRTANESAGGVVVCGYKVANMLHADIYEMLPENFGMLVLLSGKQADLVDGEEIFSLVLPVTKVDVIKTIKMILSFLDKGSGNNKNSDAGSKAERSNDDKIIIERAKLYLMNKYKITEDAAHRFLQKNSMNRGMKMIDTAKMILNG